MAIKKLHESKDRGFKEYDDTIDSLLTIIESCDDIPHSMKVAFGTDKIKSCAEKTMSDVLKGMKEDLSPAQVSTMYSQGYYWYAKLWRYEK